MARFLLIMRHAKSAWDTPAPSDFERPLAKRGLRDAPRMGKWMHKEKLHPDHVVSSPAERARQTVIAATKELGFKKKKIAWDSRIYGGDAEDLLEVLADCPKKADRVMIVGHNPGLEYLAHYLVGDNDTGDWSSGLIKTATVVHLEMPDDDWSKLSSGCAKTLRMVHPRELADKN